MLLKKHLNLDREANRITIECMCNVEVEQNAVGHCVAKHTVSSCFLGSSSDPPPAIW